jgi:hypothetical protein
VRRLPLTSPSSCCCRCRRRRRYRFVVVNINLERARGRHRGQPADGRAKWADGVSNGRAALAQTGLFEGGCCEKRCGGGGGDDAVSVVVVVVVSTTGSGRLRTRGVYVWPGVCHCRLCNRALPCRCTESRVSGQALIASAQPPRSWGRKRRAKDSVLRLPPGPPVKRFRGPSQAAPLSPTTQSL